MDSLPQTPFLQGHWTPALAAAPASQVQHTLTPHWISRTARAEAQRAHEATLAAAAGNSETYYACMAARLAVLFDVAQDRLERELADAQVLRGQLDAERARTAKAQREAADLRATLSAPGSTLTLTLGDTTFDVAGTYIPEERGDAEEPGCAAYFEASDVYVRGVKLTKWIDAEQWGEIEADCLRQCEQRGRDAAAARRWPDLAGEVL